MSRVVPGLFLAGVAAVVAAVLWWRPPAQLPPQADSFWTFLVLVWAALAVILLGLSAFRAATRLGGASLLAVALLVGCPAALTTVALAARTGNGPSTYVAIGWLLAFLVVGALALAGQPRRRLSPPS
ncbi:hypothetical protein BJF80_05890 [Serinicoccus sp. CUA-874]|uniref:hypothetical protein n=1 Tax=Serinicoccus sp. CUA-874 TaxID=1517939 RepID=UPI0009609A75|nr:hypothetical protein [Serinicoccus sp. CUA-874]OLT16830.1 hypothetical protein BJF80_05890 [Serinicoccus sp. CUA-874]